MTSARRFRTFWSSDQTRRLRNADRTIRLSECVVPEIAPVARREDVCRELIG